MGIFFHECQVGKLKPMPVVDKLEDPIKLT